MTKELARQYYSRFELVPMLFMDLSQYQPYVYSPEKSDATVEWYQSLGRVFLAVMLEDDPIGEVVFKNIDSDRKHCTLGISLVSDVYKNKGSEPGQKFWLWIMRFGKWECKPCSQILFLGTHEASMCSKKSDFRKQAGRYLCILPL